MNFDFDTLFFIGLGLVVLVLFVLMLISVGRNMRFMQKRQRNLANRIEKLRLSQMLGLMNITPKQYAAKTSDTEKARHIWACERCSNPDECNRALAGEALDANSFCPNYPRLKILKLEK